MPMAAEDITRLIEEGLPGAKVTLTALRDDDDHWSADVVWEGFAGKTRVQQHQMVYAALKGNMGDALHALQLSTAAP